MTSKSHTSAHPDNPAGQTSTVTISLQRLSRRSALLIFLCIMLVLAGCGKSQSATTGADGKKTITFYTWYTKEQFNWDKVYAAWQKAHPDIDIQYVGLSTKGDTDEYIKKLDLAAGSGDNIDVVMVNNAMTYAQRVDMGMFAPLDDLIDFNYGDEYLADFPVDNVRYAIPGKRSITYVLLNKDRLDKAGLKVPTDWTWDEFREYAKKLTAPDHSYYGVYFHTWASQTLLELLNQPENNSYLKADGTSNMDDPNLRNSFQLRYDAEHTDHSAVPYSDAISQKLNYRDQFLSGAASMLVMGSWMNSTISGTAESAPDFKVAVAPYPKNNAADKTIYTSNDYDYYGIGAGSQQQDTAFQFIRWMTTEGLQAQGTDISSWKKADVSKELETIVNNGTHPEQVDLDSLTATFKVSQGINKPPAVPYLSEIESEVNAEFEKYILQKQDLNTTIANSKAIVQQIIDANRN